jgi:hypothetical protein
LLPGRKFLRVTGRESSHINTAFGQVFFERHGSAAILAKNIISPFFFK